MEVGEFIRWVFVNGKLNLIEVEGLVDFIYVEIEV